MRFAYADPPYLGQCGKHYGHEHNDAGGRSFDGHCWDDVATHAHLFTWLDANFDGWAYSLSSTSLQRILQVAPNGLRVGAWVKPFASFKPGIDPAYAWEPVLFKTAREWSREQATIRDWVSANITMKRGFPGAKPEAFSRWLFGLLGMTPADEFCDVFHGSGAVTGAWEKWRNQGTLEGG